jgi:hypothetical protein
MIPIGERCTFFRKSNVWFDLECLDVDALI